MWWERQPSAKRKLWVYLSATVGLSARRGAHLWEGQPCWGRCRKVVEEVFRLSAKLRAILYQEEGWSWKRELHVHKGPS